MPPKTNSGASKKTVEKQKQKIVEDKTFGLKNKKGNKQQQFIAQVQKTTQGKPPPRRDPLAPETATEKKAREKAAADELKELFKPVIQNQKVAKDVDPKSVLCAFFKAGQCGKGDKCKFSHDVNVERRTEKRNLYADNRAEDDNMENWDDAKLADVVNQKHAEEEKLKPKTDIVCRHFLQAIEENKYGWFWTCPNGGDNCMYKHALPPGFVLKKDKKKMDEQEEDKISLEDLIEKERAALGGNLTRVTLDTFKAWKIKKRQERIDKLVADKQKKATEFQAGRLNGLSGRDMFTFRPELAGEDDEEADDMVYGTDSDDEGDVDEMVAKAIDESLFLEEEADGTGTGITQRDWGASRPSNGAPSGGAGPSSSSGGVSSSGGTEEAVYVDDVPVDADLFDEEEEEDEDEEDERGDEGSGGDESK